MRTLILFTGLLIVSTSFTADKRSYRLPDILFEKDSYALTQDQVKKLKIVVETMNESIDRDTVKYVLTAIGNANPFEANPKALSKKRAKIVKEELIKLGLTRIRILAVGRGTKRPLADPQSDQGRRLNPRVDFKIGLE
jgi:OOP family OmpA-OmpF porin